ncbi:MULTISPECIES: transcription elongation factor GreA [Subtercola]|uniref:Transcription elongation factor GreA n=1 Tax=Subtercola vilae TaxID=2056433 RepID=A0A4T2C3X3_9MICO|nr:MULTISPECIES: transcription elongation factor GreA [Subtercola]MEA9985728.1 transcription elongation factor GreA [Subtercola sp. RTI3]TIH37136.1 transcription elongation factor GreA [Subtercola vilae]
MAEQPDVSWLTQAAYDRLANELEYASTTGRQEITDKIQSAREEGDLKENSGYHAAKDEQGKQEARIRFLINLLKTAQVSEAPESHGVVVPGTVITATVAGDETVFLLGSREIAGQSDLDVYSEKSPLGAAIIDLKVGESTTYEAPNGRAISVKILKVENYTG